MASSNLSPTTDWKTTTSLSSKISVGGDYPPLLARKTTFTNLNKANWAGFTAETERLFEAVTAPSNVTEGERVFRRIIATASKHHIPSGRRKSHKPGISTEVVDLIKSRDRIRAEDPTDPRIPELNH